MWIAEKISRVAAAPVRSCLLRWPRSAALLLLSLFVFDLGFHFALSFLHRDGASATVRFRPQSSSPAGHNSRGCPIPGHGSDPFHHHHYPGLVVQAGVALPAVTILVLADTTRLLDISYAFAFTPARAPPLA